MNTALAAALSEQNEERRADRRTEERRLAHYTDQASLAAKDETIKELSASMEAAFLSLGRAGANADVNHPGRPAWLILRDTLTGIPK